MSHPYLCRCGAILEVERIQPQEGFRCPDCHGVFRLAEDDPRLLSKISHSPQLAAVLQEKIARKEVRLLQARPIGKDKEEESSPAEGTTISLPSVDESGELAPAHRLGAFRIVSVLGRGGMGTVYEAFDATLQRSVALKVLAPQLTSQTSQVERFRREARVVASISHPNITHVYGLGDDSNLDWFAMELIRGETLQTRLEHSGPIDLDLALHLLPQAARGLRAALAAGLIHRDLKPSNLMITPDDHLKVTDFGLARLQNDEVRLTHSGLVLGTPMYMAPEQGRAEVIDHRADLYSLGCCFYHLLSGSPPFEAENAVAMIVSHSSDPIPILELGSSRGERLAGVIARLMHKQAEGRFPDYDSLLDEISKIEGASQGIELDSDSREVRLKVRRQAAVPKEGSLGTQQFSIVDVNIDLGRLEKAKSICESMLKEHADIEESIGFRLLYIAQEKGEESAEEEWLQRLASISEEPEGRYYCRWKLSQEDFGNCRDAAIASMTALDVLLADDVPSVFPREEIENRHEQLSELAQRLGEDLVGRVTLEWSEGNLHLEFR
ncbi:MAG TPA: serine/threonine protein kinase [Planctomycetes bacterium]|nr:serine/threonine protein kinase [Planctomycetota bacterium]